MAKKTVKNRYGVQVGDIFNWESYCEDGGGYDFYQVIALRGETQVVVKGIECKVVAFDGTYKGVVPIPDSWISDQILVRKVQSSDGTSDVSIKIFDNWLGYAHLNRKEMYLSSERSIFSELLQKYHPDIAKQLNLNQGTGVFAVDRLFVSCGDDCYAIIRYPDGREEKVILRELLHYEEEQQEYERINSREVQKAREELLEQWMKSQRGVSADE